MIETACALAAVWLLGWATFACSEIARRRQSAAAWLILVHCILTGMPLALDLFTGPPEYRKEPGFYIASRDLPTTLVYCAYIALCPVLWWLIRGTPARHRRERSEPSGLPEARLLGRWRAAFWLMIGAPVVAVAMAPAPLAYLEYGPFGARDVALEASEFHGVITIATIIAVLGAALYLASQARIRARHLALLTPWLLLSFWVNGKRAIVVIALTLLGTVLWNRRVVSSLSALPAGLVLVAGLLGFAGGYQIVVRELPARDLYDSVRIELTRDNAIRMPIYAELHPGRMRILPARGDSLVFNLGFFIPREWWDDKPLPYAQYFTSAMLEAEPRLWGWAMTTSWLGEALANVGWLGLLLGPVPLGLMARLADKRQNPVFTALTLLSGFLLMTVELVAFLPVFVCWILLAVWHRPGSRRSLRRPSIATLAVRSAVPRVRRHRVSPGSAVAE